jgi:cyclophilin family peptidyl-prolyl cis-trans isomerase
MARRARPPFPINLIWNVKAFYVTFIIVMIASLAATGLATGLGGTSGGGGAPIVDDEEDSQAPEETPTGLLTFDAAGNAKLDASKDYKAVVTTDQGKIVIALNRDAPEAVNSLAFLSNPDLWETPRKKDFYNGLEFFWVLPEFDVQTGDPTCESSGKFSCTGTGGPGYDLPREGDSTMADKWTVIAPVTSPGSDQVHGSQFVIALWDELEFEGSVIGHVAKGKKILESLERRTPCFGSQSSESCQTEEELPPALTIEDIEVKPA